MKFSHWLVGATLCVSSVSSWAGQGCTASTIEPLELQNALELGFKTQQYLTEHKAEVALIARVGQDLSKYGLRYSHLGWAVRQADGHYSVQHLLNDCGSSHSDLYVEGLGNFFLDDVLAFEVLVVVPPLPVQQALSKTLQPEHARRLHTRDYSLLAYPFSRDYQNSNQWGLEILAAALMGNEQAGRKQVQTWLKQQGYQGDKVEVDPLKRMGASLFKANVAFTDHPLKERLSGNYQFVSVESTARFLQQQAPDSSQTVLSLTSPSKD